MLFFDRDIVSPVINLGWLAVALLSAYCIGRPYGLGPQALIGGVDRAGLAVAGGVPGRRGAQRHHRRRLRARGGGAAGQRLCRRGRGRRFDHRSPHRARGAGGRRDRGRVCGRRQALIPRPRRGADGRGDRDRSADDAAAGDARLRDPDARRGRVLVPAQPDRGRQPDPLHRLGWADLAAGAGAGLPAAPRLRGRPLLERHERVDELVRARPPRVVRHPVAGDAPRDARSCGVRDLAGWRADPPRARCVRDRHRGRVRLHAAHRRRRTGGSPSPSPGTSATSRRRSPSAWRYSRACPPPVRPRAAGRWSSPR